MKNLISSIREVTDEFVNVLETITNTYYDFLEDFNLVCNNYDVLYNSSFSDLNKNNYSEVRSFSESLEDLIDNFQSNIRGFYDPRKNHYDNDFSVSYDTSESPSVINIPLDVDVKEKTYLEDILEGNYYQNNKRVWKWQDRVDLAMDYLERENAIYEDYKFLEDKLEGSDYLKNKRKDFLTGQKNRINQYLAEN